MKVQLLIFRLVSSAGCRLDVFSHLLVTPLRPIQDLRATENDRVELLKGQVIAGQRDWVCGAHEWLWGTAAA